MKEFRRGNRVVGKSPEKEQRYLIIDYETYSECDIKKTGAYEYAAHQSTEILCMAYVYGTRRELRTAPVKLFVPTRDAIARDTRPFVEMFLPDTVVVAHNAFFEQCITRLVLPRYRNVLRVQDGPTLTPERWLCTAALAAAMGLPRNLEGAGKALGLAHQKDAEGHRLMLKLCKPRKPTKNNPDTRHTDPKELQRLYEYCIKDVEAERELFLKLPPLTPQERKIWILNQEVNLRGFAVDRKLVLGALHCIEKETSALDARFQKLTGLDSARQRNATLECLKIVGCSLPNLQAGTVDEYLQKAKGLHPKAREILEIRQSISKSSTAKYSAFEIRSRSDGRARDNTIYYGAHTGREAGAGLQPQNLFKSTLPHKDVLTGIELIKARDVTTIQALYPRPMDLYASALRSCIVAPKGHVLDVGDFATIEVRVLFWLAGETEALQAIVLGRDLYIDMAGDIYDEPPDEIRERYKAGDIFGIQQRQLGKQTVLGAGFGIGLGGEKFQKTALMYKMEISLSLAQKAIQAYRDRYARVVKFWSTIERAAIRALENPGKRYRHSFLVWCYEKDWLSCTLPSGRRLHYFKPRMEREQTLYGDRLRLTYRGIESVSKQFMRLSTWGGKLTENVVQAVARDVLMDRKLALKARGHSPVLTVHDEIVCERSSTNPDLAYEGISTMFGIMAKTPKWAPGLPVKVEGWSEARYRK